MSDAGFQAQVRDWSQEPDGELVEPSILLTAPSHPSLRCMYVCVRVGKILMLGYDFQVAFITAMRSAWLAISARRKAPLILGSSALAIISYTIL